MPVTSQIELPRDQYLHTEAPTEWWWHVGTLNAGNRAFGFEINVATRVFDGETVSFSQIMLTDVVAQVHYQQSTVYAFDSTWAESDPSKPWYARLGNEGGDGAVSMTSPDGDVEQMHVVAGFLDKETKTQIGFDLDLHQNGNPLLVWGDGRSPVVVDPGGTNPYSRYNFYYSFTNLAASGTITIGDESLAVTGLTWMDHEYGAFSGGQTWVLQDAQLDNGVHLSNFATAGLPVEGVQMKSSVTVLSPNGNSTFLDSLLTPMAPVFTSVEGVKYCLTFLVEIPDADAALTFMASMPDQEFRSTFSPVYEGSGTVTGTFGGEDVSGTAWIEQALGQL